MPDVNPLIGKWTYRSFLNNPDLSAVFNDLEFGRATIEFVDTLFGVLKGTISGPEWSLDLQGSINFGNPITVRFQGTGVVGGEQWVYDYLGYATLPWPNGINQRAAMTGTIVRTVPHSGGSKGSVAPAGVVCSWIAVHQDSNG